MLFMNLFSRFPEHTEEFVENKQDYFAVGIAFTVVVICFVIDSVAGKILQNALGVAGWIVLFLFLLRESNLVRAQVYVAVIFATIGEHFASVYMEGYIYRFSNVPAFVPPGHGIVYLTAVILGRTGLFMRYARKIALAVSGFGVALIVLVFLEIVGRSDEIGTVLLLIYMIFLFKGRSPMVYLGAFFITNWVEIVGTSVGTWYWSEIDPASTLTQGNPPLGVAAWYCLVDAVAIWGAPFFMDKVKKIKVQKVRRISR